MSSVNGARSRRKTLAFTLAAGILTVAGVGGVMIAPSAVAQSSVGSRDIVAMRRLTESQYRHSIADIFGPSIRITGRFEPEVRTDGLIAIGAGQAGISASGMEQYYAIATSVASQVMAPANRKQMVPCEPAAARGADDACARAFFTRYGRLLYRRPLEDRELTALVGVAHRASAEAADFYVGLEETLSTMLTSPNFLFRIERAGGPAKSGMIPLDDYSRASRLSFLLWDSAPDDVLLTAAQRGELAKADGLQRQVDRLASSPRLSDGVSAFFDDMLQLDRFASLTKDAQAFPKYSQVLADQARQQTLRTILNLVLTRNGDYRDVFTTRDTFMTRSLALVYQVPYTSSADWAPYSFTPDSGRTGVISEIGFLALFGHPAESSPTKRGVALNEIFLCQPISPPPANVDFSAVTGTGPGRLKTVRERLSIHATTPACASCHTLMDPPGLSLERFDSLGQSRDREDGEPIDVHSQIDGVSFEGAPGLGQLLHDDPRTTTCLVRDLYSAGIGRPIAGSDRATVDNLTKAFSSGGYRLPAFLKSLVASNDFYLAPAPSKSPAAPQVVASAAKSQETK